MIQLRKSRIGWRRIISANDLLFIASIDIIGIVDQRLSVT